MPSFFLGDYPVAIRKQTEEVVAMQQISFLRPGLHPQEQGHLQRALPCRDERSVAMVALAVMDVAGAVQDIEKLSALGHLAE